MATPVYCGCNAGGDGLNAMMMGAPGMVPGMVPPGGAVMYGSPSTVGGGVFAGPPPVWGGWNGAPPPLGWFGAYGPQSPYYTMVEKNVHRTGYYSSTRGVETHDGKFPPFAVGGNWQGYGPWGPYNAPGPYRYYGWNGWEGIRGKPSPADGKPYYEMVENSPRYAPYYN